MTIHTQKQQHDDLVKAIETFENSNQKLDDYRDLVLASSKALRQGIGLGGEGLEKALQEAMKRLGK